MKKSLPYLTILLFGIYGAKLFLLHKISFYISYRYELFFLFGATVCLIVGGIGVLQVLAQNKNTFLKIRYGKKDLKTFTKNLPIVFTLLVALLLPAWTLHSASLSQQPVSLNNFPISSSRTILPKNTQDYTFQNWIYVLSFMPTQASISGKLVKITGFVYRAPDYRQNVFMVSRFQVTCCSVDATLIGLPVKSDKTVPFQQDEWVEVKGKFAVFLNRKNEKQVFIVPSEIKKVKEPEFPYTFY